MYIRVLTHEVILSLNLRKDGLVHIAAALSCLLFVSVVTEWIVEESIVKISSGNGSSADGIDLASSLYDEYQNHFSQVINGMFTNFTDSSRSYNYDMERSIVTGMKNHSNSLQDIFLQIVTKCWLWLSKFNVLTTTLNIFDLPGIVTQKHYEIW